jgi:hypothetical protein
MDHFALANIFEAQIVLKPRLQACFAKERTSVKTQGNRTGLSDLRLAISAEKLDLGNLIFSRQWRSGTRGG